SRSDVRSANVGDWRSFVWRTSVIGMPSRMITPNSHSRYRAIGLWWTSARATSSPSALPMAATSSRCTIASSKGIEVPAISKGGLNVLVAAAYIACRAAGESAVAEPPTEAGEQPASDSAPADEHPDVALAPASRQLGTGAPPAR